MLQCVTLQKNSPIMLNILQHARTGNIDKLKPLLPQCSGEEMGQALRAAIVHGQHQCVDFLVPHVTTCQSVDAAGLTPLEHAFWTTIVHKKNQDFDCILKHIDPTKNDSSFLYMACMYQNSYAASRLIPFSNMQVVWERMENQKLEKECFDVIRQDYEAFQQRQFLNTVLEPTNRSTQRKI